MAISKPIAPTVLAALFFTSTAIHTWQCLHYQTWQWMAPHLFCAAILTMGYTLAAVYAFDGTTSIPFLAPTHSLAVHLISRIFIRIAPPILVLANLHVFTFLLQRLPILPSILLERSMIVLTGLTCCIEATEGVGVALRFNSRRNYTDAGWILAATALALQVCTLAAGIAILGLFGRRYRKTKTKDPITLGLLAVISLSMALVLIRSAGCLVQDARAAVHARNALQAPFWVADGVEGAILLVNSLLWNVCNRTKSSANP
ncbi:hypothetical protein N7492_009786 [Penicillium capsulatum]|uniref:Uncharacterized protein n=1 Tax=Penicillium capsulatum TaxID=69766 RepID=A0A9W9HQE1_9EURO|nr:hypothetical protein N7492_009786 [Penicillium capsulatum]KAJ6114132.1 hypothetical protein N7512_007577 [Penicillium capsulatum]